MERSSDQVVHPVNMAALTEWVGTFPRRLLPRMAHIAPMLATLGYDPLKNPPNYGQPDQEVANNTKNLREREDYWSRRKDLLLEEMRKPTEGESTSTDPEDDDEFSS